MDINIKRRYNFGEYLNQLSITGFGIEIGVGRGQFSAYLLEASKLKKLYLLDAWKHFTKNDYEKIPVCNLDQKRHDKNYNFTVGRLKKYGDRVEIIRADCREVVKNFQDDYFDLIYIDADHEYENVKIDLNNWFPKLRKGGVFSGHDYFDGEIKGNVFGVKKAVDEFCKLINITPNATGASRRCAASWYFIK